MWDRRALSSEIAGKDSGCAVGQLPSFARVESQPSRAAVR